jgi:hypothetical protein
MSIVARRVTDGSKVFFDWNTPRLTQEQTDMLTSQREQLVEISNFWLCGDCGEGAE